MQISFLDITKFLIDKKRRLSLIFFIASFVFFFSTFKHQAQATINETINVQGKLVDSDGTNFSGGCGSSCDFRFTAFEDCSGTPSQVYQDTFSNVTVTDGIFNVKLGDGDNSGTQNFSAVDFDNDDMCVQVELDADDNGSYEEDFGNATIASVGQAFRAKYADYLGSLQTTDFLRSNADDEYEASTTLTFTGNTDFNGNMTITDDRVDMDASNTLFIQQSGDFTIETADDVILNPTGQVGISTTNPDSLLHVVGGDTYIAPDSGYTFDHPSANEDLYVYGNLEVDGNIYGPSTGVAGFWDRTGTVLSPATDGDSLRVDDGGGTDYIDIAHDGINVNITTANTGVINFDNTIQIASGSEAAFADAGEYISSDGTDMTIASGADILLSPTGNVGIDNTTPGYKLDIQADSSNQDLFRLSHPSSPTAAGFMIGFNTDGTTDNNTISLGLEYSSTDYDVINMQRDTRYVGIGTTDPNVMLEVNGGDITADRGSSTSGITRTIKIGGAQLSSGTNYATVDFQNYDGSDYIGARIASQNDDGVSDGDLRFSTYNGSLTEQQNITPDGIVTFFNQSRARATRDTDQTISNTTITKVQYATETYDEQGEYDNSIGYDFTATEKGYYAVSASVIFKATSALYNGEILALYLYKEGRLYSVLDYRTSYGPGELAVNHYPALSGSDHVCIGASEYIDIRVYQASGSTMYIDGSDEARESGNYFAIHKVS